MSIELLFAPSMRVGGETIRGEVELRFPKIIQDEIEEVHVKLRGRVYAKVARQIGDSYVQQTEKIEIVRENISVWTKGSAYPTDGSGVLRIPFQFLLPRDVQPSFKFSAPYKGGDVSYFVGAVGVRPGFLTSNRRVSRPFAVVPPDPTGLALRTSLQAGWTGELHTITKTHNMRRGIWGAYAETKMELILPQLSNFPLFTKIPFTLRIVTTTKEMKYDEKDEHKDVFPEPPRTPQSITFLLRRKIHLNAKGWKTDSNDTIAHLGGLGKDAPSTGTGDITFTFNKKWVPSVVNTAVGNWKQETMVGSSFELKSTPSFATPILSQRSYLRVKVGFHGIGNTLEEDYPIETTSGVVTPPTDAEAPPYDSLPSALDLPPTYWSATAWDDGDEKVDPFASKTKS